MARKSFEVIDVTEILTYWYAGRPKAGGIERYVTLEEPNDADHHAIDDAYRTKYARYARTYVEPW